MMKRSIVRTGRWAALCSVVALASLACQKKDSPSSQPSTRSMPDGEKTTPTEPPHNPKVTPKIRKTPLEEFYAVGRVTNTVILSNAAGKASNTKWAIKATASFYFETDVEFKDRVVSNSGGRLVLERTFTKVRQALFVTKKSLGLSLPKGPLIDFVTNKLVGTLAPQLKMLLRIVRALDPDGEKTLNGVAVWANKHLGYDIIGSLGLADFKPRFFDQIEGVTFRITYANGGKIIQVVRTDGKAIPLATLAWLQRTHGILMDRKVFPDRSASIGKAWSVKAADLGMMLLEPQVPWAIRGTVSVSRVAPCPGFPLAGSASRYAGLEVEESRVTFVKDTDESRTTAWIIPAGCLVFDLNGPFVTYGDLGFTAGYESLSKGHLLFGSTFTTTVRGSLYYQHEVMPGR